MFTSRDAIVVGLGELLWDCFPDGRRPGGAPANVAFHANQLGCCGVVATRVGTDSLGNELIAFLQRQGLRTEYVQRDPRHPTGTVTVDMSRPDHPRFVIHEDTAWDYLDFDAALEELMASAAAVCFGTLAQRSAVSRRTIHQALAATRPDCLVVYDVNLRQHWYQREWIEQSLEKSSLVKLNCDEVAVLADVLRIGPASPEAFAKELQARFRVDAVCVTRAAEGCLLVDQEEVVEIAGLKVEVVDAVGAGDAFTAAWLFARLRGWPANAQAQFANHMGALVVTRPGAMPELRQELATLTAQYG